MEVMNIILSCISIVLSVIAFGFSLKNQKLQNNVNELEIQIKQDEIEKIKKQHEHEKCSKVESRVIKISQNNYRLKIYNLSEVAVYNVDVKMIESKGFALLKEGLTPYEILEPKHSFDMLIAYSFELTRKFKVLTTWQDKDGKDYSKEQLFSLN
ncbi:MAG: hypothetical protein ACI4R8_03035 [Candidatus Caccovivens sp.]